MSELDDEIIAMLAVNLPAGALAMVRTFKQYGLDSLHPMFVLLAIESKFGFKIPDADVDKLDTANNVLVYVHSSISKQ